MPNLFNVSPREGGASPPLSQSDLIQQTMRNKGGDNIAPRTDVTIHLDTVDSDDMPCSVYAMKYSHSGETVFRLELFNTSLWMSPQQVKELRLALKPSRLESLVDDLTE